ncbi:hypothetical protein DFH11DRAFT_1587065 [Phellopilus nigrolimitatus]|nr:hypothetical protein DFH11DRAFT_1587065 [Phellopilus nigrolimitatus]
MSENIELWHLRDENAKLRGQLQKFSMHIKLLELDKKRLEEDRLKLMAEGQHCDSVIFSPVEGVDDPYLTCQVSSGEKDHGALLLADSESGNQQTVAELNTAELKLTPSNRDKSNESKIRPSPSTDSLNNHYSHTKFGEPGPLQHPVELKVKSKCAPSMRSLPRMPPPSVPRIEVLREDSEDEVDELESEIHAGTQKSKRKNSRTNIQKGNAANHLTSALSRHFLSIQEQKVDVHERAVNPVSVTESAMADSDTSKPLHEILTLSALRERFSSMKHNSHDAQPESSEHTGHTVQGLNAENASATKLHETEHPEPMMVWKAEPTTITMPKVEPVVPLETSRYANSLPSSPPENSFRNPAMAALSCGPSVVDTAASEACSSKSKMNLAMPTPGTGDSIEKSRFCAKLVNKSLKPQINYLPLVSDTNYARLNHLKNPLFPISAPVALTKHTTTRKFLISTFRCSARGQTLRPHENFSVLLNCPFFVCLKLDEQPYAPQVCGAHGLLFDLGEDKEFQPESKRFKVIVRLVTNQWLYTGDYVLEKVFNIVHISGRNSYPKLCDIRRGLEQRNEEANVWVLKCVDYDEAFQWMLALGAGAKPDDVLVNSVPTSNEPSIPNLRPAAPKRLHLKRKPVKDRNERDTSLRSQKRRLSAPQDTIES